MNPIQNWNLIWEKNAIHDEVQNIKSKTETEYSKSSGLK